MLFYKKTFHSSCWVCWEFLYLCSPLAAIVGTFYSTEEVHALASQWFLGLPCMAPNQYYNMQNTYFFHPKHSVGKRDLLHLAASEVQLHGMDQGGHVKDKQPVVSLKDQLSHGVSKDEKPPQGSDAMYKLGSEARTRGAQQAMVVDLQASPPRQRCEQRQEQHEHNHSHLRNNPLTALAANRLRDVEPLRLHRIMEALYGEDILLKDLIPLLNPSPCACEKSRCRRGADSPNSTATNSPRPARGEASGYRPGANSPNSQATISSAALQGKALDHGLEDVRIGVSCVMVLVELKGMNFNGSSIIDVGIVARIDKLLLLVFYVINAFFSHRCYSRSCCCCCWSFTQTCEDSFNCIKHTLCVTIYHLCRTRETIA